MAILFQTLKPVSRSAMVCAALLCAGTGYASSLKVDQVALDFTLQSLDGPNLRLEDYRGQVVLGMVIDPSGRVVGCKVVASEITDRVMIDKVVNRVRMFDFEARDVTQTTIRYPVHFLPT